MPTRLRAVVAAVAVTFIAASLMLMGIPGVSAAGSNPSGPDRFAVITQNYTSYEWWLTSWSTNKVECSLDIDHTGLPLGREIYTGCGKTVYDKWIQTKTCSAGSTCGGYYLQLIGSSPATRKISVALPPPVVHVSLNGCYPFDSTYKCTKLPSLVLSAEEPIDGESITGISGVVDGKPFACSALCQLDLVPTTSYGINVSFWAFSSYGDSSNVFTARVRVTPVDDASGHYWFADVISEQWNGGPLAPGSLTWEVFPPLGGVPAWLSTPRRPADLATDVPYAYLAGHLIQQGIVDASSCPDLGLLQDGTASTCGMEVARSTVNDWQDRFDSLIYTSAQSANIPAQLLKNIFARESQFWPGISSDLPEAGLGQLTEGGADTTLLWNRPFYEQFCPTVLDEAICEKGYPHLQEAQQILLDDALVKSVDAFCEECPLGIDLSRAENSIDTFAEVIYANTEQVGMLLYNIYGVPAGTAVGYEDLWRFTMVNYNAGPGCLTLALFENRTAGTPPDWEHVSTHFTPYCQHAVDYVSDISVVTP